MQPTISIITATRDAMAHLPRLAASLLVPQHDFIEWIVVDGCSVDGTVEFLRRLDDARLSWRSEPDDGIYDAWNKAVGLARGRWIIFVGADDELPSAWLHACAAAPAVQLVYGDIEVQDPRGRFLVTAKARPWAEVAPQMRRRLLFAHPGLAHHRSLFEHRRFDSSFRIAGDFHFLAGADLRDALRLGQVQAVIRLGGVSNRADRIEAAYQENLRVVQSHGGCLPFRDRCLWYAKRKLAAASPTAFESLQSLGWRWRAHP